MKRRCFACGRVLGKNPYLVTCADEQDAFVGSECYKEINRGGTAGWQPPKGGPRLYTLRNDPKGPRDFTQIDKWFKAAKHTLRRNQTELDNPGGPQYYFPDSPAACTNCGYLDCLGDCPAANNPPHEE